MPSKPIASVGNEQPPSAPSRRIHWSGSHGPSEVVTCQIRFTSCVGASRERRRGGKIVRARLAAAPLSRSENRACLPELNTRQLRPHIRRTPVTPLTPEVRLDPAAGGELGRDLRVLRPP